MATQPTAAPQKLTDDQLAKALEAILAAGAELAAGNTIDDATRTKVTRLYGRVVTTKFDADGDATDEDLVRNNAILMIAAGVGFGDIVKYMVDCLTGNPVTAGDTLDDDPDLLDDLGGTTDDEDPDLATPAPAQPAAAAKKAAPATKATPTAKARQRGGVK